MIDVANVTYIKNSPVHVLCNPNSDTHGFEHTGFQEELIENVVLPQLKSMDNDPDVEVRSDAVQLVIELTKCCQSQQCADLLAILEKVPLVG